MSNISEENLNKPEHIEDQFIPLVENQPPSDTGVIVPKRLPGKPSRFFFADMLTVILLCWIPCILAFFLPWEGIGSTTPVLKDITSRDLLLAAVVALPPWIILTIHLGKGRLWDGTIDMLLWAFWECFMTIILFSLYPEQTEKIIYNAKNYWSEMHGWIENGSGPEGDPSVWWKIHLTHLITLIIGGFLAGLPALVLGVLQLNYMNYYVSQAMSLSNHPLLVLAVSWHFWSIVRVAGFIILASSMYQIFLGVVIRRPWVKSAVISGLVTGLILVILDAILKFSFAENVRQTLNFLTR